MGARPRKVRPGRIAQPGSASEHTGYRVTALLDAQSEAALGVLQHTFGLSIASTIKRALVDRAANDAPERLESAIGEVMARRTAVAARRR